MITTEEKIRTFGHFGLFFKSIKEMEIGFNEIVIATENPIHTIEDFENALTALVPKEDK